MPTQPDLPSGRVTFAFTDVVGSTRLFREHGQLYVDALRRLRSRIDASCSAHGGRVVKFEGDGAFLVFGAADDAVAALREIQAGADDAQQPRLDLRAGAHSGEAVAVDGDYVSLAAHVAARVTGSASAGQVFVSSDTADELAVNDAVLLGEFALKDLTDPITIWRAAGDDVVPRAPRARRTNVAASRTTFVGRDEPMARIRLSLESPGVISVVGPGGVGKTRLIIELALLEATHRQGGAWLVELGQLDDGSQIIDAVGAVLGVGGDVALIAKELRDRVDAVLLLDNCEHVIDDVAAFVDDLRDAWPELRVAATSREALGIPDELVVRLRAFSDDPEAAAELFTARAAAVGAVDLDLDLVQEICAVLDGLPLALELAAAQAADLPLTDLLRLLHDGGLTLARRGGLGRQRSVENLVAWSLDQLGDLDVEALYALSTLPAGFDLDLAAAALGTGTATAATLARLTRRSLVDLDGARYRLLYVVRQVARRQLAQRPEHEEAVHRRLLNYCVGLVPQDEVLLDALTTSDQKGDLALTFEYILSWGLDHGATDLGTLIRGLESSSYVHGTSARLRELCGRVVHEFNDVAGADQLMLIARAWRIIAGRAQGPQNAPVVSREVAVRLVVAARRAGDRSTLLTAMRVAASSLWQAADYRAGRALALEALQIVAELPDSSSHKEDAYIDLGVAEHLAGDLRAAEQHYRQAYALATENGHTRSSAWSALNLGEVLLDRDDAAAAVPVLTAGIALDRLSAPAGVMTALLAEALYRLDRTDDALVLGREAMAALGRSVVGDPSLTFYLDRLQRAVFHASEGHPSA